MIHRVGDAWEPFKWYTAYEAREGWFIVQTVEDVSPVLMVLEVNNGY